MTTRLQKGYLQWRCRRGTKELDVILTRYLEKKYKLPSSLQSDLELVHITQNNSGSLTDDSNSQRESVYQTMFNPSHSFASKLIPKWSEYFIVPWG